MRTRQKGVVEYYMVKLKYSALYTDDLGCEQAEVYLSGNGFQLSVRNCIFVNDDFDFDFYAENSDEIRHLFNLKGNELIEYAIDIKIPAVLNHNEEKTIAELLLRIEKNKNYYNNSLSLCLKNEIYHVEGYNFQELLKKMKNEIPEEYSLAVGFESLLETYCMKGNRDTYNSISINLDEELNKPFDEKSYLTLVKMKSDKSYERIPITYIDNKYCLS